MTVTIKDLEQQVNLKVIEIEVLRGQLDERRQQWDEELRKMKKVLKQLGYISNSGVLSSKGRFCCELSTADELVVTDMVFDGLFNDLSVEQAVALLSCFIHKEEALLTRRVLQVDAAADEAAFPL